MRSIHWIKGFALVCGLSVTSILISCGDDKLDIPDVPLTGTVAGQPWEFKMGLFAFVGGNEYELRFFSTKEFIDDPCAVGNSSNPYMRVVIPSGGTTHTLPLPTIHAKQFFFDYGNGTVLRGESGFVEIFISDGLKLHGFVQAITDDDNSVQGRFTLSPC